MTDEFLWAPLRSRLRWWLAALSVISVVAHLPVLSEHLREVPYIGVEFMVLILACLLIAIAAPREWPSRLKHSLWAIHNLSPRERLRYPEQEMKLRPLAHSYLRRHKPMYPHL